MNVTRVYVKSGRYYYVEDLEERKPNGRPKQKWHALTRVDEGEDAKIIALARHMKGEPPVALAPPGTWLNEYAALLFRRARDRADAANIHFDITKDDVANLGRESNWHCSMTGIQFSREKDPAAHAKAFAPSIDRIDSSKGYTPDNIRLVCVAVNLAMNEWGEAVFHKMAHAYIRKGISGDKMQKT